MRYKNQLIFILFLIYSPSFAVKIQGTISDAKGEPLGFASVIVRGENIGTMANEDGKFWLELPNNKTYEIVFQFLGYKSVTKMVAVNSTDLTLNVVLEEQSIRLNEVNIGKGNEDPAYAIMRKAIAKSKIHDKQVDAFDADAYIKGTLVVNQVPFLFKKALKDSDIKLGVPFVTETLVNIKFSQPNKRVSKILAQKNSVGELSDTFTGYYLFNFYNPPSNSIAISPLSARAFSYYKFEYLGYFEEKGKVINKIKIIPKTYGSGILKGTIYIIEDLWCLHSINAETVIQGSSIKINQLYAPTQQVWVPISQLIDVGGKILGFEFKGKFQLSSKYKSVKVNQKYVAEIKIVDEGERPVKPKKEEVSWSQRELSLKEMNRLAKQMEKEQKIAAKEQKTQHTIREDSVTIDSLAKKRDLQYWESMRSIPLSTEEVKGYKLGDSLKIVRQAKADSSKNKPKTLISKVFFGGEFLLKKVDSTRHNLKYESPLMPFLGINYNLVEGVYTQTKFTFSNLTNIKDYEGLNYKSSTRLRYSFGQSRFMASTDLSLKRKKNELILGGGSFTQTFDAKQNVPDYANTILNIFKVNLTQLYLKQGGYLGYTYSNNSTFWASTKMEYANRSMLQNSPHVWGIGKREPTPNQPSNQELTNTAFPNHNAIIWSNSISFIPGAKYRLFNGKKIFIDSSWPELKLNYTKGFRDVDYDFVSFGLNQNLKSGPAEKFLYFAEVGSYLNSRKLYLMDMRHINSVNYELGGAGMFSFYRLLNTQLPLQLSPDSYYNYSTKGSYIKLHALNEFRKLAITQIPIARYVGLKEDLFINYLKTPMKNNYLEIGYGIDGIYRLLRLEVITALENGHKPRWGWQIGITF